MKIKNLAETVLNTGAPKYHHQQYVILLHALCGCGTQSNESDDVRDQMDEHWYRMTDSEIEDVARLSITLTEETDGTPTFRRCLDCKG